MPSLDEGEIQFLKEFERKLIQGTHPAYQFALSDCLQWNYLMDFLPDKCRQLSQLEPWGNGGASHRSWWSQESQSHRTFETEKGVKVAATAVAGRDCSQVLVSFSVYCCAALLCSSSGNISGDGSHLHEAEGYFIGADCNAVNDKAVQRIAELFWNYSGSLCLCKRYRGWPKGSLVTLPTCDESSWWREC